MIRFRGCLSLLDTLFRPLRILLAMQRGTCLDLRTFRLLWGQAGRKACWTQQEAVLFRREDTWPSSAHEVSCGRSLGRPWTLDEHTDGLDQDRIKDGYPLCSGGELYFRAFLPALSLPGDSTARCVGGLGQRWGTMELSAPSLKHPTCIILAEENMMKLQLAVLEPHLLEVMDVQYVKPREPAPPIYRYVKE